MDIRVTATRFLISLKLVLALIVPAVERLLKMILQATRRCKQLPPSANASSYAETLLLVQAGRLAEVFEDPG